MLGADACPLASTLNANYLLLDSIYRHLATRYSDGESSAMKQLEDEVARQYAHGSLGDVIEAAIARVDARSGSALVDQLASVDEFHVGGRQATAALCEDLHVPRAARILDVGCGLGGTARFLASRYDCHVTGVDLSAEYVSVGQMLNARVGLTGRVDLRVGSAAHLPFADGTFDVATFIHVGMNIPDKQEVFSEVGRVLKSHGALGVYDIMHTDRAAIQFPVPWADTADRSFLAHPEAYRSALEAARFTVGREENRRELAIAFFRQMKSRVAEQGLPPLGLHILMGQRTPEKVRNLLMALESRVVAPVEMIARGSQGE